VASSRAVNAQRPARCYQVQHGTAGPWQVVTGSKRWSLLMAGDDEMFITRSLNVNVTPKTTEQHLIVRSDKYVTYVTNNKRLRSTFRSIEANYWQTRSIARPLCDSRATCFSISWMSRAIILNSTFWHTSQYLISSHVYFSCLLALERARYDFPGHY